MAEIASRMVKTNAGNLHVAGQGQGAAVQTLHGLRESGCSWCHGLTALAQAGIHTIAPRVRGNGESDVPEAIEA